MTSLSSQSLLFSLVIILVFSDKAYGFGAGNIASLSKIEGQNWRHGDIEDTLLSLFLARVAGGRRFGKLDVKRVYFGNWLRDYSQAVDVGTVKYVSAEAIRILIWVLGFMSFGYGTREFEVTSERLGCYQPTEHIDNPLGYAEGEDARNYDRRLRGPVDEERELSVDPRTGLKAYIASEDMGIDTSAALIRHVFGRSILLGRRYARSRQSDDLYEALRLMGTGLHCLEDYAAHSNYTELSLIELGERGVFPHVGRNTPVQVEGAPDNVYPIVTGTFGGVDFFHSVLGEFSDKTKQSELQSLEGVITESENDGPSESFIQNLLSKIPDGLVGDSGAQVSQMDDFKAKADDAKQNAQDVSPREPEEWTRYLNDVQKQVYPILEWHDKLLKTINDAIEHIPVLPELIEQLQDQITIFVFSILAPYILPIIKQVKQELETGSSEVIQSSQQQQHIVFNDDDSSNPTHSMLSKDHFSNVLNEPAGRIASNVVRWTVPQLMHCWDDEEADVDRTLTRIISGVFHHPALHEYGDDGANEIRQIMFSTVQEWWGEHSDEARDYLREQLSREGVLEGKNHKEGIQDCGHGCGKPLSLPKGPGRDGGIGLSNDSGLGTVASEALGGGALGGLVGGLVGSLGSMVLNDSGLDDRATSKAQEKDDDNFSDEHSHRHQRKHHHRDRDQEAYEDRHSHPQGYGYQGESAQYGDQPSRYAYEPNEYSRSDYPPEPPAQDYHREGYGSFQAESIGAYYQQERRETFEGNHGQYVQTQSHYEYATPQDTYQRTTEYSSYGRNGLQEEFTPEYGEPPCRGYEEFERPADPPFEESYGQPNRRGDDGGYAGGYHHHSERQGSDDSGSQSGSDEEHARRHRRHHRHHHHHHDDYERRSGSDDSD
ncbi:Heterokaryon incompatibility Het-C [Penicillium chermesinum]|uniref:Heterokaryon incompatibility Het-C n=1 Tax=Penicillium chermesinum TaxID=63820 RepID=A0A9W9TJK5_9EURO|nr:Heterokaryon incompatibility Het-C [Penicillium chermesinum]KAJ5225123.1 Heterokaryon incompatibility Het-C [Penicillium chermesinum]